MSQYGIWLYPVGLGALITLIISIRTGLRWTWGVCLQQLLVLACAVVGLAVGPDWLFAIAAWLLFFVFTVGQKILLQRLNNDLSLLRTDSARRHARLLSLLAWGPPGRYWRDIAAMIAAYVRGDPQQAGAILQRWQGFGLPAAARDGLVGFTMLGRVILRDWAGIVADFQSFQPAQPSRVPVVLPYQIASRAYAELGNFSQSVRCLELADLPSSKCTQVTIDTQFMSFFALAGARGQLEEALSRLARGNALPEYARLTWLARCLNVCGETGEAKEVYRRALEKTPGNLAPWRERIAGELARLEREPETVHNPASPECVARAERLSRRARQVIEIVHPQAKAPAVNFLVLQLVAIYAGISVSGIFDVNGLQDINFYANVLGRLDSASVLEQFQWWRLITYQFLHANLSHLVMNVLGLLWFGKLVEGMYGTRRFVFIYLSSGILSGLAQILLAPGLPAVGASGAILGVFGAGAAGMVRLGNVLPAKIRRSELTWMLTLAVLQVGFDNFVNLLSAGNPAGVHIAGFAHLGGMIAGFILGMLLPLAGSITAGAPADAKC